MSIIDSLYSMFTARLKSRAGEQDTYIIEVPADEVERGPLAPGNQYRVALLDAADGGGQADGDSSQSTVRRRQTMTGLEDGSEPTTLPDQKHLRNNQSATEEHIPVEKGDQREVTISDVGDEGDGIAKVEEGYVLIVELDDPETGENKLVEITSVGDKYGFAAPVED